MEKHDTPGEGRNNITAPRTVARDTESFVYRILFARVFVEMVQPLCSGTHLVGSNDLKQGIIKTSNDKAKAPDNILLESPKTGWPHCGYVPLEPCLRLVDAYSGRSAPELTQPW